MFLLADAPAEDGRNASAVGEMHQVAVLLEGLRALSSGKVLDDVLALVIDSAIAVGGAERGFIMLAGDKNELEFKLGRSRDRVTLPGSGFETSRKIPEEVFRIGQSRIEADLLDGDLASLHSGTVALGIRNVLCVPLRLVRYVESAESVTEDRRVGVLYLDSREKGTLMSNETRATLEALAAEAAVAIDNAQLYRAALEKARLDQERWPRRRRSSRRCYRHAAGQAGSSMRRPRCCRAVRSAATSSNTSTCPTTGSASRSATLQARGRLRRCSVRCCRGIWRPRRPSPPVRRPR